MLVILFLGLLCTSIMGQQPPTANNFELCLRDFADLLPITQLSQIFNNHLLYDAEFNAALNYLLSNEWKMKVKDLVTSPLVLELIHNIESELSIKLDLNSITAITPSELTPNEFGKDVAKKSFKSFLRDVKEVMPCDALRRLWLEKVQTCPHFQRLYKAIKKQFESGLIDKILFSCELRRIAVILEGMDVPVNRFVDVAYELFNTSVPVLDVYAC